jgi:Protein of unknown function (DUF2512)
MRHVRAFAIKFIVSLILLYIILGVGYDMAFRNVFWITLVLGVVSYLIGDLLILPRSNNSMATLSDFVLAFVIIWFMGRNLTYGGNLFTPSLISAVGVALFEYFFHKYVSNRVINETGHENVQRGNLQYQTEASEELAPEKTDFKNDKNNK